MIKPISEFTQKELIASFPQRSHDSHKGMFGDVAIIGGAPGMLGAAVLAARAALKLGAGCVHVGLLAEHAPVIDMRQPELMMCNASDLLHIPGTPLNNGQSPENRGKYAKANPTPDVFALGCGMGQDQKAQSLLHSALNGNTPLVLDADALNILADHPNWRTLLHTRNAATVITPHPGEAARLLSCSSAEVQANRLAAVKQLADKLSCSVVLKGASTLCATRDGQFYVNQTGNPGMSAPGMGDVLTGIIAAFIAQGMTVDKAMLLAVHLHGAAGDALADQGIAIGMTATEVTDSARRLLNTWLSFDSGQK